MPIRMHYTHVIADGMKALAAIPTYLATTGLPRALRELVNLHVSQINGCAYCIDYHTREVLSAGVTPEKLALLPVWREGGPLFDTRERAALAWAESVTLVADTGVPQEDYDAAIAVFSEKELGDLTLAVAAINAYNRLAISFRAPPKAVHDAGG
jgi:AhpD family alkylhydroperoxidase